MYTLLSTEVHTFIFASKYMYEPAGNKPLAVHTTLRFSVCNKLICPLSKKKRILYLDIACPFQLGRGVAIIADRMYTAYVHARSDRAPGSFAVVSPDTLKQRKRVVPSVEAAQQEQTGAK